MGPFNNREIAIAIWLLALLIWAWKKADLGHSLASVAQAFCKLKVLIQMMALLVYVTAITLLFNQIGLWKVALLKDTIVWFCFGAVGMVIRFVTSNESSNIFRKVMGDNIRLAILVEFLVNTYTFSLPIELIFTPLMAVIVAMNAYSKHYKEYASVKTFTDWLIAGIGLIILAIVLLRTFSEFQRFENTDTLISIAIIPLLSLSLTPFLYGLVLISKYELIFIRLNCGTEKSKSLRRYTRNKIYRHAGFSLAKAQQFLKNHAVDLMRIQSETDIDQLLLQAHTCRARPVFPSVT